MGIVTAAVKAVRIDGSIGQAGFFRHRQRIHVGSEPHRPIARMPSDQTPDDTGLADTAMNFDAPGRQLVADDAGGPDLLEPDLRMRMNVLTDRNEFRDIARDTLDDLRSGSIVGDGVRLGHGRILGMEKRTPDRNDQRPLHKHRMRK